MIRSYMEISMKELTLILAGLEGGKISDEAEAALRARIEEGKSKEYPMGEVKRQLRARLSADDGKKIADAIEKLW